MWHRCNRMYIKEINKSSRSLLNEDWTDDSNFNTLTKSIMKEGDFFEQNEKDFFNCPHKEKLKLLMSINKV